MASKFDSFITSDLVMASGLALPSDDAGRDTSDTKSTILDIPTKPM
jgi:hypothetical protein